MAGKPSQFVQAVDAFVASPKTLVLGNAAPEWERARDTYGVRLKLALEISGEQHPGQHFLIDAYPDRRPSEFVLTLLFGDHAVCRVDYEPTATHTNTNSPCVLPYVVKGPHWHSWELNRLSVKVASGRHFPLHFADALIRPRNFGDMLRFYCHQRNIALGAHPIEFPHPEMLIS